MSKRGENIYKRKDGRWEGRYVKCRTLYGKIQYGYVYGKNYSETKAKLKENASAPIRASSSQATQSALYGEVLKAWLLSSKNRVKESTFSRYNHLVERHIQSLLGSYPISEISTVLLEECIDYLLENGRLDGDGGLSPKSVSDIIVVMKSSIRYALGNGYHVNCSPAGLSVKKRKKDMRVLSKKEQQQLECILLSRESLNGHALRNKGSKQPVVTFVLGTFPRGVGMRKVDCTAPVLDLTERRELRAVVHGSSLDSHRCINCFSHLIEEIMISWVSAKRKRSANKTLQKFHNTLSSNLLLQ